MLGKKICGIFILGLGLASGKIIHEKTLNPQAPVEDNKLHADLLASTNLLIRGAPETSTKKDKMQNKN